MNAIEVTGLTKHYGAIHALGGVDLCVPAGCIFGFLGPNGAGKTTAMRIFVGLLRATGGAARVLGLDAWGESQAIRAQVGYLPGDVRLYEWMRGRRLLSFCNRARGGGYEAEIVRLTTRFDLDIDRPIRDYSRGMKQKLGLIAALMHRPRLLILDEPTTALDPLVQQTLYDELRATAADGRTVLFSSHTLGEVEQLCDRVAIIRGGRIIEDNTITELRKRALRRVELRIAHGDWQIVKMPSAWTEVELRDGTVIGVWTGEVRPLLTWLVGLPVQDVVIGAPDLEELFATYYREGFTVADRGGRT
ncbi:MAG: ABC transporter ATP-binding protein [Planctomycetota bacterium]